MFDTPRAAALAALLGLLGCEAGHDPTAGAAPEAERPGLAGPEAPAGPPSPQEGAKDTAEAPLPTIPELDGINSRGAFDTDGSGRFVPSRAAVEFFEYNLGLAEDAPVADVRLHLEAAIRRELAEPEPALALLDRYLVYREELHATDLDGLELSDRLDRVHALRRQHFPPELADALFAAEEGRARFEIEWRRIAEDPSLTDVERERRLEEHEQQLPGPVRLRRKLARVALQVEREEAELRAEGVSEEEIRARRNERYGATATERLEQLRATRAAWDARVARYREARTALLAELEGRGAAERERALEALRNEHFEPSELDRLRAVEAAEDAETP
ncbi:MAG: lipase secretion chaperone [Myxococcota bacterium]|nr:lipase secretion chaperone [Myxococcota bacterium]